MRMRDPSCCHMPPALLALRCVRMGPAPPPPVLLPGCKLPGRGSAAKHGQPVVLPRLQLLLHATRVSSYRCAGTWCASSAIMRPQRPTRTRTARLPSSVGHRQSSCKATHRATPCRATMGVAGQEAFGLCPNPSRWQMQVLAALPLGVLRCTPSFRSCMHTLHYNLHPIGLCREAHERGRALLQCRAWCNARTIQAGQAQEMVMCAWPHEASPPAAAVVGIASTANGRTACIGARIRVAMYAWSLGSHQKINQRAFCQPKASLSPPSRLGRPIRALGV